MEIIGELCGRGGQGRTVVESSSDEGSPVVAPGIGDGNLSSTQTPGGRRRQRFALRTAGQGSSAKADSSSLSGVGGRGSIPMDTNRRRPHPPDDPSGATSLAPPRDRP